MKKTAQLLIFLFIGFCSFGQSELPEFASSKDKVLKKVKLDMPLEGRKYKNGTGYSLNPKLLNDLPKKVALVSFYSFDPGMTKTQTWTTRTETKGIYYNTITTTTHIDITKRNAMGASGELALGFYLQSIGPMIEEYGNHGMDLLLPEEFLDTEEKIEYYNNFVVERAKFNAWITNMGSSNHEVMYGYPEGYNVIDVVNEVYTNYEKSGGRFVTRKNAKIADNQVWVMDKCGKMVQSLGSLCTTLDVDAIVVVYFTIFTPKEDKVTLQNVNMHMFGPNPTPLPEGKDKKFNYFDGQFYCGTRVNPEVLIYSKNKKKPGSEQLDFTGFDLVMQAMTERMASYLKEGIEKGK